VGGICPRRARESHSVSLPIYFVTNALELVLHRFVCLQRVLPMSTGGKGTKTHALLRDTDSSAHVVHILYLVVGSGRERLLLVRHRLLSFQRSASREYFPCTPALKVPFSTFSKASAFAVTFLFLCWQSRRPCSCLSCRPVPVPWPGVCSRKHLVRSIASAARLMKRASEREREEEIRNPYKNKIAIFKRKRKRSCLLRTCMQPCESFELCVLFARFPRNPVKMCVY
jgi:hypothetical protein